MFGQQLVFEIIVLLFHFECQRQNQSVQLKSELSRVCWSGPNLLQFFSLKLFIFSYHKVNFWSVIVELLLKFGVSCTLFINIRVCFQYKHIYSRLTELYVYFEMVLDYKIVINFDFFIYKSYLNLLFASIAKATKTIFVLHDIPLTLFIY